MKRVWRTSNLVTGVDENETHFMTAGDVC